MNSHHTIIIAEAGVNHNGSINRAKKLIDVAKDSGADIVKFQTFKAKSLVSKKAKKAEYQKINTNKNESHYEMLKKLELSHDSHLDLIDYSKKKKIKFLSSPFDNKSIEYLKKLDLCLFKIPSGEITNFPYLSSIGKIGKPIIMSTGMATIKEIASAMEVLLNAGLEKKKLTILHCNTDYPTLMKDVNLKAMLSIKNELNVEVGYSDHTLGIEIPIAAVALGAKVIEKHFTLDRRLPGPDHSASLEPMELKSMISSIRNIEIAMGDGQKKPSPSEIKNILIARKSIFAKKNIKKGDQFSEQNLTTKRPGTGISPMKWNDYLGKKSTRNYEMDEMINE